ncbi:uncharacterized protein N7458_001025 [Penicillium daleae]|uniref:Uncharacterized protein n=1 Tax=Penicillium daleae TaxID=63821 RepID=A0AAD6CJY7_9EURO|nr:uncharacterized protein N7458_001025 [Penicillium daleae]KAJ5465339.1 hypothetical protein N7458_001025 [Penicillium daleae]
MDRWHSNIDRIVLDATASDPVEQPKAKTAIVCPPTIYGTRIGPVTKRSVQIPDLAKASLRRWKALTVIQGQNEWRNINVADLADAYVILVEEAFKGGGKAYWNGDGYFFIENRQHTWKDEAKTVAMDGFKKGYLKTPDAEPRSVKKCLDIQEGPALGPAICELESRIPASEGGELQYV